MMSNVIFTMNDKHTQLIHKYNRLQKHANQASNLFGL